MGQSLTTLYEIIPLTPELRSAPANTLEPPKQNIAHVKVAYKTPDDTKTKEVSHEVWEREEEAEEPSDNFKFSAAVAQFGMLLLSKSEFRLGSTLAVLVDLAKDAVGEDRYGYRAEFIKLIEAYGQLAKEKGGEQ